jgi:H+/Cl- antiporter ClcA
MRTMWWQRLAPLIVIAGLAVGAMFWRHATEARSEGAKQQVFTALHTVNQALRQIDGHLWRLAESAR